MNKLRRIRQSKHAAMRTLVVLYLAALWMGYPAVAQNAKHATTAVPVRSPEVTHTGKAPTGYTVTFRYWAPKAKRVQIQGEWYFARPSAMLWITPTPDYPTLQGPGLLPKDWQPGDFPFVKFDPAQPYRLGGNWAVADLTKGKDGVWVYTTPMPSGVFTYSFNVDCADPCKTWGNGVETQAMSDPNNRPWNETKEGVIDGSIQHNSQVYVPSDANFGTVDYSWQAPAKHRGRLVHLTYPSPGHVKPMDVNYVVVYTPPNYDPARAKPYPTLYLSQGTGGGNEMNWSTEAVVNNILDNLINSGQIRPMVAVMPDEMDFKGDPPRGGVRTGFFESHDEDVIHNLIPYIEQHYHVSTSATDRAFAGFSMGGSITNSLMINCPECTEAFQYYGVMDSGLPPDKDTLTPQQIAALKGKSIFIGAGWQDPVFNRLEIVSGQPVQTGTAAEVSAFVKAGIPLTTDFVNGGHEYSVFRILLRDFVTRVAFWPRPYAAPSDQ
jgi:enterochelin esterase-like enzyme